MKKTIFLLTLICALTLSSCAQPSVPTETPEASKQENIQFTEGQLYAVAWVGYGEATDLPFYLEQYIDADELPTHYISGGDYYLVIPRYENMKLELYKNDMTTNTSSLVFEESDCGPFLVQCNVSDIFSDATVALTYNEEQVEFSPAISLMDGSFVIGEYGLNITK